MDFLIIIAITIIVNVVLCYFLYTKRAKWAIERNTFLEIRNKDLQEMYERFGLENERLKILVDKQSFQERLAKEIGEESTLRMTYIHLARQFNALSMEQREGIMGNEILQQMQVLHDELKAN